MVFRGTVRDGIIILEDPGAFPDGSVVEVRRSKGRGAGAGERKTRKGARRGVKGAGSLSERLGSVIGRAKGLPKDFAARHDHYIRGTKR